MTNRPHYIIHLWVETPKFSMGDLSCAEFFDNPMGACQVDVWGTQRSKAWAIVLMPHNDDESLPTHHAIRAKISKIWSVLLCLPLCNYEQHMDWFHGYESEAKIDFDKSVQ
jgi:hypothetical protein